MSKVIANRRQFIQGAALVPLAAAVPSRSHASEYRLCVVSYKVMGNGPWNYAYERPPEGADEVRSICYFISRDGNNLRVAKDLVRLKDGSVQPVRITHYDASFVNVEMVR